MTVDIEVGEKMAYKRHKSLCKKKCSTKEKYPHFRHYKKSGHPALILSEDGDDKYKFRRVTSSEFSGHHRNQRISPNPDKRRGTPMYIVKQKQSDHKKHFSSWKYPWKMPKV